MALLYSFSQLIKLNNFSPPLCISAIKTLKLLRRPRYIHRASRRKFVYSLPKYSTLFIPSLWSAVRTAATPARHHHNNFDVRAACLRPFTKAPLPVLTHSHLKIALFNTRSLNNKGLLLNEFITDNNLDFLFLTETWQNQQDYFSLNQTTPPGYSYMDKPRHHGRGGGIATIYRKDITTSVITIPAPPSFEHLVFKLSGPKPLVTAVIYRPPKPNPAFPSDLSEFLTQLCAISPSILLLGDFNIHIDSPDSTTSTELQDTHLTWSAPPALPSAI